MPRKSAFEPMLYIVAESPAGPCKVGFGANPKSRLMDLQIGNPRQLTIASLWKRGDLSADRCERLMHHLLAKHAMRGEWFDISVAEIEAICSRQDMVKVENTFDYTRKPRAGDTRLSWLM